MKLHFIVTFSRCAWCISLTFIAHLFHPPSITMGPFIFLTSPPSTSISTLCICLVLTESLIGWLTRAFMRNYFEKWQNFEKLNMTIFRSYGINQSCWEFIHAMASHGRNIVFHDTMPLPPVFTASFFLPYFQDVSLKPEVVEWREWWIFYYNIYSIYIWLRICATISSEIETFPLGKLLKQKG